MKTARTLHPLACRLVHALLLWLLFAGIAQAQKLCIPTASGVPALSGAPNFLDSTATGPAQYWPRLDDPRWRGALARSYGTGASQEASFRALKVGGASPAIYLSWFIPVDSQLDPNFDFLRVGFSPGGGQPDEMIDIVPFKTVTQEDAVSPPGTSTRILNAGTWTVQASEPAWVAQNTRVWLDVGTQMWAINMRVPVQNTATYDTGIRMSPTFKMAFELQVSQAGNGVVYYRLNDSIALTNLTAGSATNTAAWTDMSIESAPLNCSKGVSIASTDVGTTYVDATNVARPNRISITGPNTFFAAPTNNTGAQIGTGLVSATFRIANWGTQPDWNDIPNPTTSLWKTLNTTLVTNGGAIANGATASVGAGNALTFQWTPSFDERCELVGRSGISASDAPDGVAIPGDAGCPNATPTRKLHQCILVELSGGGFLYTPQSVYRNMDYVKASVFKRDAEISVAGLAPAGGAPRDVYLYVQKFKMPENVANPQPTPTLVDWVKVQQVLTRREPGIAVAAASQVPTPPPNPPLGGDFSTLNQIYPTYIVYAFRDTGETRTVNGQVLKLLKPQSSFGYYVTHEGELYGWDTTLAGAQEIAPNYYRVAAIPEGGTKTVTTGVTAVEQPRAGSQVPWWILLILLVVAIAVGS